LSGLVRFVKQYEGLRMLSGYLVNSVEGGVSWVELDLGQDSVSGWGSSGNSNWGSSSKRSGNWSSNGWGSGVGESWGSDGWSSGIGDDWGGGDLGLNCGWGLNNRLDKWGMGNSGSSWENSWGSNWESSIGKVESSGIWVWESSDSWSSSNSDLFSLSLSSLSRSGGGLIKSSLEFSLGSSNLWGILNGNWDWEVKDWSLKRSSSRDSWSNWEVGAGNSESVDWVSNIVDSLEETVGVNILVGAGGHSIGVSGLSSCQWTTSVSKRELSKLILSMELCGRSRVVSPGDASNKHLLST